VDKPDRVFPACAVTRTAARRARVEQEQDDQRASTNNVNNESSSATGVANSSEDHLTDKYLSLTWEQLIKEQEADAELCSLIEEAVDEEKAARYGNFFTLSQVC